MKALVLARGKGTRMQRAAPDAAADPGQSRIADTGLKAMIPFRRPFLDYILSALADAGCLDVCLIIGPEHDSGSRLLRAHATAAAGASLVCDPGGGARDGGCRSLG